jgi:Fe-S cluster assembly ATPase SufC
MGPSGGGKSTFMNVLTGKAGYGVSEGDIFVNGKKCNIADYRNQVGFGKSVLFKECEL